MPAIKREYKEHEVHGDIGVEFTKPPMRFGTGLYVTLRSNGEVTHHATRIDEDGGLIFVEYDRATDVKPLLMVQDGLMTALQRAVADLPLPTSSQSDVRAHLADAISVRDKALALVLSPRVQVPG